MSTAFIRLPLLVADVFRYEYDSESHAALRVALGRRGGVEGFAIAATMPGRCGAVSHGVVKARPSSTLLADAAAAAAAVDGGVVDGERRFPDVVPLGEELLILGRVVPVLERVVFTIPPNAEEEGLDHGHLRQMFSCCTAVTVAVEANKFSEAVDWDTVTEMMNCVRLPAVRIELIPAAPSSGSHHHHHHSATTVAAADSVHDEDESQTIPVSNEIRVPPYFLWGMKHLASVDLSQLVGVTSVGDSMLSALPALTRLDLSGLSQVTSIGTGFVSFNPNLAEVDLSSLGAVTTVGHTFCHRNASLTRVDEAAALASSLNDAGADFFCSCVKLREGLGPLFVSLSSLTHMSDAFLQNSAVENVDLSACRAVVDVGDHVFSNCCDMKSISGLSGLTAARSIGRCFLAQCVQLQSIEFTTALTNLTAVGDNWLEDCHELRRADFSGLTSVTRLGNAFLSGCSKLRTVDWSGLQSVTHVGSNFAFLCRDLEPPAQPQHLPLALRHVLVGGA